MSDAERCAECGYSWSITVEDAVLVVAGATERFGPLLSQEARERAGTADGWS
ncbi:MAG: hypothetical protein QOI81_1455, partial [Actinomycetota bacterium]|nr:hypothetical protein [Actinomycetota bacterium]